MNITIEDIDLGPLSFDSLMEDLISHYDRVIWDQVANKMPEDPVARSKINHAERAIKVVHQLRRKAKIT